MPHKDIALDANFFSLLEQKGMNRGLIDSSLRVLEESGFLKLKSDLENKHFVQFSLEPPRLNSFLKNFTDNEAKDLILFLVREYGSLIFNSKVKINIQKLCGALELSNHEIINQFERLSSIGILAYEKPSLSPAVSLLQNRALANEIFLDMNRVENIAQHSKMKLEKIIDYANTDDCRFKYLLEYFGQQDENYKCNKCDRCRGYVETGRVTLEYLEEIILQTIHEAKLPIKKKNVLEIVTGKTDLGSLKKFSTFGTGVHFKKDEIDKSLGNLERAGLITILNNVLSLSEKGLEQFSVIEELDQPAASNKEYENDLKLFNLLRQIRKEASERFNQKPNLICPDEVMRTITKLKPSSPSELLNVSGFNSRMFNKIGEEFLSTLKEFRNSEDLSDRLKNKNLPDNINQVLELIQKKYSLVDIASLTKLPEAIVSTQIETLIEAIPDLEIDSLFEKNELKLIYEKIDLGFTDLKALRELLRNTISFAKLRIAAAKKRVI